MGRKLLVVGSNSIHVYHFIDLVKEHFDEVLLLSNATSLERSIPTEVADFSLGLKSLRTIRKIRKIVEEFQPSVVHIQQANTYAFLTVLALKNKRIPLVLTAWGSDILVNPSRSLLLKKMLQYSLKNVEAVTADSDHVLHSAQQLVNKKLSLHNINFGIDIKTCEQVSKENIIYSNRLHKALYNIDKVIHAFAVFLESNPEWTLVVAGRGEDTASLKALVHELGLFEHVLFVGFLNQQENHAYYCRSKIYISIPKSDSISISLVEAILCGCVPFVSDLVANRELIKNGENGFIEEDLGDIDFGKYTQINKKDMQKTREHLASTFSKAYNAKRYFKIYDEVCV